MKFLPFCLEVVTWRVGFSKCMDTQALKGVAAEVVLVGLVFLDTVEGEQNMIVEIEKK